MSDLEKGSSARHPCSAFVMYSTKFRMACYNDPLTAHLVITHDSLLVHSRCFPFHIMPTHTSVQDGVLPQQVDITVTPGGIYHSLHDSEFCPPK